MGNDKLKMEIYFVHVEYKFGFSRYFDFFCQFSEACGVM